MWSDLSCKIITLDKNWANVFAEKFSEVNITCVLKFNGYWLKKSDSRKVRSPFFRAKAVCNFESCRSYIFYIEDVNIYDNGITVKFISEGSLLPQHTSGTILHSRHLSYSQRNTVGKSLFHSSVSKVYYKQFNNSENFESFSYGNLTHLKSQDCLRMVKSQIPTQNRFSNLYMDDIAATQQFFDICYQILLFPVTFNISYKIRS